MIDKFPKILRQTKFWAILIVLTEVIDGEQRTLDDGGHSV